ncbi:hypothetical protein B0H17DRAFT_924821 [Mycena rosella]|uniref:Malate dehydrogenase n=1 Tax=Mycena rosella TaxID=1033263 RepID=A0AAD7DYR9_MYCRO|nr:hypothetical protein B0H17DRAFT_924821 [Mycena rosella]
MLAWTLLSLLIASVSAVPSTERSSGHPSRCDLSAATISLPSNQTVLVAPAQGPSYIGLAIGTQNYTCASTGTWTNVGAVAELFDVSCLYGTPEFPSLQEIAYTMWKFAPPNAGISEVIAFMQTFKAFFVLGQRPYNVIIHLHPYVGTGISPKWDFTSAALAGHPDAFVIAAKVGDIPAPTGPPDVDWLSLNNVQGNLATQVFRVDTVGGLPPASCTAGSPPIVIKYASTYCELQTSIST